MLIDGLLGSVISSLFTQVAMKMSIYYCGSSFFFVTICLKLFLHINMCVYPGLSLNAATSGDVVFDLRRVNQEVEPPSKLFFCFLYCFVLFCLKVTVRLEAVSCRPEC